MPAKQALSQAFAGEKTPSNAILVIENLPKPDSSRVFTALGFQKQPFGFQKQPTKPSKCK
jgi:hypothetical protein